MCSRQALKKWQSLQQVAIFKEGKFFTQGGNLYTIFTQCAIFTQVALDDDILFPPNYIGGAFLKNKILDVVGHIFANMVKDFISRKWISSVI